MRVKLLAFMLGVAWMAAPLPALADAQTDAKAHFARGVEFVDAGRPEDALAEFLRAYELSPHHAVLYNVGQAYVDLGKPREAVEAFERYLAQGGALVPAARRSTVEQQLKQLQDELALIEVRVSVADALVRVDGSNVGHSPLGAPVRANPGTHVVSATAPGHRETKESVTVAAQQRLVVRLVLDAETAKAPAPAPSPPVRARPSPEHPRAASKSSPPPRTSPATVSSSASGRGKTQRVVGVAAGIAGLVGLGIGTAFAIQSASKDGKSDHRCGIDGDPLSCNDEGLKFNREAIQASQAAVVSFALGGAAAAGGLVLILTAPSGGDAQHAGARPAFGLAARGLW